MNSLIGFLKSRIFLINFGISLVLGFSVLFFVYRYLDNYTQHGETITVPDLRGMQPELLEDFLSDKHLRFEIIDSSVFDIKKARGAVIDQDPPADSKVKENRTIYLTVNKMVPLQVKMPNLVDASYRQAEAVLQTYGLKVGELIYRPDMAKNAVIGQQQRGREIRPGTMIQRGAVIDLILGDGLGDTKVEIPDLSGMTINEAEEALKSAMLNKGAVIPDETVKDTLHAKVYKQIPAFSKNIFLNQGASIDIFVTQSEKKIPNKPEPNE